MSDAKITISKDGPYLVSGDVPLAQQHVVTNEQGASLDWREGESLPAKASYALCRCGQSSKKPYCDGTHKHVGFDGTETAGREAHIDVARQIDGPEMTLLDAPRFCVAARFCHGRGEVWELVGQTDDPAVREIVAKEAGCCPSGRLVALTRASGEVLEPALPPSIGLMQDTAAGVSGPLWVRGGIPVVSADGTPYEVRNRVTLCRCGASGNKPFCDGTHLRIQFQDGT